MCPAMRTRKNKFRVHVERLNFLFFLIIENIVDALSVEESAVEPPLSIVMLERDYFLQDFRHAFDDSHSFMLRQDRVFYVVERVRLRVLFSFSITNTNAHRRCLLISILRDDDVDDVIVTSFTVVCTLSMKMFWGEKTAESFNFLSSEKLSN